MRASQEDLRALWKNQKELENLHLNFNSESLALKDFMEQDLPLICSLKAIKELDITFPSKISRRLFLELFECLNSTFELKKVSLRHASEFKGKHFFASLREPMKQPQALLPAGLTHLSLTRLGLFSSPKCRPRGDLVLDDFPHLEYLSLQDCQNPEKMLDAFERPKLKEFRLVHTRLDSMSSTKLAAFRFLRRFGTLESLCLDFSGKDVSSLGSGNKENLTCAIESHHLSLQSLLLRFQRISYEDVAVFMLPAVLKCKKLKELLIYLGWAYLDERCVVSSVDP